MAGLPKTPWLWFDFSQGNYDPVKKEAPNLGSGGGNNLICGPSVSFHPNINNGVAIFNNIDRSSGISAQFDPSNSPTVLHLDRSVMITFALPMGIEGDLEGGERSLFHFGWKGGNGVGLSFNRISGTFTEMNVNKCAYLQTQGFKDAGHHMSNHPQSKIFYTYIFTSSLNDGLVHYKIYDHYNQSFIWDFGYTLEYSSTPHFFSTYAGTSGPIKSPWFDKVTLANHTVSSDGSPANNSLNCYIANIAYWTCGMSNNQMNTVIDCLKHRFSQTPKLP